MSYNLDHIESLIIRSLDHSLETEEQQQLQAWLEEDADHRRYYETLQQTWELTGTHDPVFEPDVNDNWVRFQQKLEQPSMHVIPGGNRRNALRVAAGVAILLGAATLYFLLNNQREITVLTAAKEKKSVVLPDGSRVFMNQNSSLRYASNLTGPERAVYLEGEAYFDVAKQQARPFVVYANGTQTQVLGTTFDVKAYTTKPVEISVLSGKVAVSKTVTNNLRAETLILTPGRKAIFKTDAPTEENAIKDPNLMAWKDNKLVFYNTPMREVLTTLENYYGVRIEIQDSSLIKKTYVGTFTNGPALNFLLTVMTGSMNAEWTEKDGGYIITGKKY
jgi:transmembrane sensor